MSLIQLDTTATLRDVTMRLHAKIISENVYSLDYLRLCLGGLEFSQRLPLIVRIIRSD